MSCYEIIVKKMRFVRMNKLSFQQFCKIAFGSRKNERMQPNKKKRRFQNKNLETVCAVFSEKINSR